MDQTGCAKTVGYSTIGPNDSKGYTSYAITITPSPYKKHDANGQSKLSYKGYSHETQKSIITHALRETEHAMISCFYITDFSFELTLKDSIHFHGTINTMDDQFNIDLFTGYIVNYLGYNGKNNKTTDTIYIRRVTEPQMWSAYIHKLDRNKHLNESPEDPIEIPNVFYKKKEK